MGINQEDEIMFGKNVNEEDFNNIDTEPSKDFSLRGQLFHHV